MVDSMDSFYLGRFLGLAAVLRENLASRVWVLRELLVIEGEHNSHHKTELSTKGEPMKRPLYNESNVPSVSGGRDNPPDRYAIVQLTGALSADEAEINKLSDQGFRFEAFLSNFSYVLMGNYKENK